MSPLGLVVLGWGVGWAVASVLLPVSAHLVDWSSSAAVFAAAIVVGTPLLGVPIYVTARQTGARYPAVEATLWVLLLAVIVAVVARAVIPPFEPVNAVTTQDMRRRQQVDWHYPPELVWGLRGAAAFCLLAAWSAVLVNGRSHGGASHLFGRLWRAVLFSVGIAISLGIAALCFVLAGPLIWRLIPFDVLNVASAAFLAGCLAGGGILAARRICLH
jgi:hypothetical protein